MSATNHSPSEGVLTRPQAHTLALLLITAPAVYVSYRILAPFFSSLAWAVAFAVVGAPMHRRLAARLGRPNLAAGLSSLVVACILILPIVAASGQLVSQAVVAVRLLTSEQTAQIWHEALGQAPQVASWVEWATENVDLRGPLNDAAARLPSLLTGSAQMVGELSLALFCLFFLFRDEEAILAYLRSWMPLSDEETDEVSRRIHEIIQATIFGKLVLAGAQGFLGGIMFWLLGLRAPVVWGVVMALLGLVPFLGAFVVWLPAALYLGFMGFWGRALVLGFWGLLVVSTVDNVLYPFLVGHRMQLHPMATMFSVLGGLGLFGASGIILGPVLLATTVTLLEVLRRRFVGEEKPA